MYNTYMHALAPDFRCVYFIFCIYMCVCEDIATFCETDRLKYIILNTHIYIYMYIFVQRLFGPTEPLSWRPIVIVHVYRGAPGRGHHEMYIIRIIRYISHSEFNGNK